MGVETRSVAAVHQVLDCEVIKARMRHTQGRSEGGRAAREKFKEVMLTLG